MLPVMVKRIVEEKSTKINDYLVLLGIGRIEHWITIIIDNLTILGLQSLIIVLIFNMSFNKSIKNENDLYSQSILDRFDFSLLVIFIFLFLIQSILFAYLISIFFKSPNIAVIATTLVWISSFIIPIYYSFDIQRGNTRLSIWGSESLTCLIPNCALFWFIWISNGLKKNAYSGASWSHLSDSGYLTDEMTLGHVLLVMLSSYPLYVLLIWYLSSIIPNENTIPKPFYFPLQILYKKYLNKKVSQNTYESMTDNTSHSIIIKNVSKKYKSRFGLKSEHVLKNIDLEVEDKSITVILGPNGSGKTTLINIIMGNLFMSLNFNYKYIMESVLFNTICNVNSIRLNTH